MLRLRIGRLPLLAFGLVGLALMTCAAQEVRIPANLRFEPGRTYLRYSKDSALLHVIGQSPGGTETGQHVRALTYDSATGAIVHIVNLQRDTMISSLTLDGKMALVASGGSESGGPLRLFLLATESGKIEDIPSAWFDPKETNSNDAGLSGDGRLVSIYSESGPPDAPLSVSVYSWTDKTLLARQSSEFLAAGGAFSGGITDDGAAVGFSSNRAGWKFIELKTGRLVGRFGADSVRSPDGKWVVEFPDQSWVEDDDPASRDIIAKDGATGEIRGRVDAHVLEDEAYGQMTGAFCGTTDRIVVASAHRVAVFQIPSGMPLASFATEAWRDPGSGGSDRPSVACSSDARRVAILSGERLTLHKLN